MMSVIAGMMVMNGILQDRVVMDEMLLVLAGLFA